MSTTRSNPVQVAGYVAGTYSAGPKLLSTSWSKVSVGPSHVIAIKSNNTLWAWGANDLGQLGDGTVISRSSPVQIGTSPTYAWYDVSAGNNFSAALRDDRLLYVWGLNTSGQLGQITDVTNKSSPVQILAGSWKAVSAGGTHVVAIDSANKLWSWGLNTQGQLGLQDYFSRSSPTQVGTSSWIIISAGNTHTTAISSDSGLFTWGNNAVGQLGYTVTPVAYSWSQIAGNAGTTIAIRNDGLLFTWGNNSFGMLGDGTTINRSSPVQIGTSTWSFVSIGAVNNASTTVFAIRSDKTLWGWGLNAVGQLGIGDAINRSSPVQVSGGGSWIAVSASQSHAVALKSDNTLYTWGTGTSGQLGDGITSRSSPVKVGTSSWTKVSAGDFVTYAIRTDGALFSWGINTNGQLGDLNIAVGAVIRSSPTQIGTGSWTSVFANGGSSTFAIDINNKLFAWGLGTTGQLGYNDAVSRSSPVQISSGNWSSLAESNTGLTTLALQTDGSLWAWGAKFTSLLLSEFSNTTFTYSWSQISAGPSHTAGIRSDGRLYTWGLNSSGQIGDFTTVNKSSPVLISARGLGASGEFWNSVSANGSRTMAVRNDGTLWAWGSGNTAGLGLSVNRSQPVQLGISQTTTVSTYTTLYSTYFNGVSDTITIADNATLELGASNFTIECWIFPLSTTASQSIINKVATGSVVGSYDLRLNTNGTLNLLLATSSGVAWASNVNTTGTVTFGNWNHVAWVRNTGGVFNCYINGVSAITQYTTNITLVDEATTTNIGANGNGTSNPFTGYLSNVRITKGQALYTANFTPSTTPLTTTSQSATATNVIVLACQNTIHADNSIANSNSNPWVLSIIGNPIPGNTNTPFNSYVTVGSSWTKVSAGLSHTLATRSDGGLFAWGDDTYQQLGYANPAYSVLFPGTSGNYLTYTQGAFSTIFTLEMWVYLTATSSGTYMYCGVTATSGPQLYTNSLNVAFGNTGGAAATSANNVLLVGVWQHIAAVREGTGNYQTKVYVNGSLVAFGTEATTFATGTAGIGNDGLGGALFTGYISGVRITNGQALYTSLFDVTTTPLTLSSQSAVGSNVALLALQSSTLIDNSTASTKTLTLTGGGATIQTLNPFSVYPIQVGTSSWTQISAGGTHSLAIDKFNLLYSWGNNTLGQAGQLATPLQWTTVNSYYTTQIIRNDGIVYVTGWNNGGQLGDGTVVSRSSPVQLSGGGSWSQIVSGYDGTNFGYSIGIKTDGTLYTWGLNSSGILGDSTLATTATRSSPVQVGTSSWISVSTMNNSAVAIRSDYTMWAWGKNDQGQLGDGTTVSKSAPIQIGSSSWTQVSVGASSAVAIKLNNTLYVWGLNANGQIGDGTVVPKSSPVQIGSGSWLQASTKNLSTFAIFSDYTLWAWGDNSAGKLGINDTAWRSSPTQVNSGYYFDSVSAGFDHALAKRRDGTIVTWGLNDVGQLGLLDGIGRSSPVQIGTSSWVSISAGYRAGFGITTSGGVNGLQNLYAWGQNDWGALGINDSSVAGRRSSPTQVATGQLIQSVSSPTQIGTNSWTTISAGLNHSIAVRSDYKLYAWGDNSVRQTGYITPATVLSTSNKTNNDAQSYIRSTDNALIIWGANDVGQLGDGTTTSKSNPVQLGVGFGNSQFAKIARAKVASAGYTLGVKTDGTLWAWGSGANGVLGNNATTNRSSPVQVGTLTTWSDVAAGPSHALAIKTDGSLWGWGSNTVGQAGRISWAKISSGSSHTLALRSDGALYGWGSNTAGQVGDTTIVNRNSPVQIGSSSWSAISAGINVSAAIRGDSTLWVWGLNTSGQLGQSDVVPRSSPTQVGTAFTSLSWTQISVRDYIAGLTSDFRLFTWGSNAGYQLGDGTTNARSSPVQVGSSSYTSVSSGGSFAAAIRTDGRLFLWGTNTTGQLGLGDVALRSQPTQIGSSSWSVVSSSNNAHTLAVTTDGKLYAWGNNFFSQLGLNDTVNRSSPVQVGSSSWTNVYAGTNYSLALRTDSTVFAWGLGTSSQLGIYTPLSWTLGNSTFTHANDFTLWAWGDNQFGQLGISSTAYRSSPVQIDTGATSWTYTYSTTSNAYAIKSDGTMWAWGRNYFGQLGLSDTIDRSSPVQVGTDTNWSTVVASATGHALAIKTTGTLWAWGYNQYNELGQNELVQTNRSAPVQVGSATTWTKVSAGNNYSLGISAFGLWAWGRNDWGQTGNPINAPLSWTQVAGGDSYSVAIRSDGKLFSWGLNNKGQLGLGHTINKSTPAQVAISTNYNLYSTSFNGSTDYLQVTYGVGINLASTSFTIEFWGYSTSTNSTTANFICKDGIAGTNVPAYQVYLTTGPALLFLVGVSSGSSTTTQLTSTVQFPLNQWVHVAVTLSASGGAMSIYQNGILVASNATSVAMVDSARPLYIGYQQSQPATNFLSGYMSNLRIIKGQVLYTANFIPSLTPLTTTTVGSTGAGAAASITGTVTLLTLQNDRYLDNSSNNFAFTTTGATLAITTFTPFQTTAYNYSFTQVSATLSHVLAIRNDGGLFAWGANDGGQLGQGNTALRSAPIQIGSSSWTKVAAGSNNSFAIRTDGALFGWGDNTNGILGQSNTTSLSSPLIISSGTSWTNISARQHILATTNLGAMYAWGLNNAGQLGTTNINAAGDVQNRSAPVQIGSPNSWNLVSAGSSFSIATGSTGLLYTWGLGTSGQLGGAGNGTTTAYGNTSRSSPSQVGASSWSAIASGISWAAGISAVRLYLWGGSVNYEAGVGNTLLRSSPVQLGALSWTVIGGTSNPIGIQNITGSLFAWGTQTAGQLGQNDVALRSSPVQIASLSGLVLDNLSSPTQIGASSWTQISAGDAHGMALRIDSGLFTWGKADYGQLGSGNSTHRSSPVQVGSTSWSQISAGNSISAAITTLGSLQTWGRNNVGQLGAATTTDRNAPAAVGTSSWSIVSASKDNMFAVTTLNQLFAWGYNAQGQFGDSTTANRSSPVQIGLNIQTLFSNPTQISSSILPNSNSVYFNGTNDYLTLASNAAFAFGTGNFTIEFWMYSNTISTSQAIFDMRTPDTANAGFDLFLNTSTIRFSTNGALYITGTTTLLSNTWYHIALSRTSTTSYQLFLNGVQEGSTYTSNQNHTNNTPRIGNGVNGFFSGYISNLRVILGQGLYTGTFTPSRTALTNNTVGSTGAGAAASISGTLSLLTCQSTTFIDNSGNNFTIQLAGMPIIVSTSYTQVSAGESDTTFIATNGVLFNVGDNTTGQIGDSTVVTKSFLQVVANPTLYDNRSSPAQIGTGSWSQIAAGLNYSVAIKNNSTLYTWGDNTAGYLGNGTTLTIRSMTQIGASSYASISSGGSHTVALKNDLTLYAWGLNNAGQLGDNSTTNRSSPVQVNTGTITSWNSVSAGASHSMGIDSIYNIPYGWGLNTSGQIGDTSTVNKSNPVQISSPTTTNYSYLFNGTTQYLSLASNAAFAFGTGNFTIEFWMYSNTISTTQAIYDTRSPVDTANAGFDVYLSEYKINFGTSGTNYIAGATTLIANTWYHIALSRSGTTTYQLFVNGLQDGTYSTSQNFTNNTPRIGNGVNGFFSGYISNMRIIKGTALYTTGFYPSAGALTTSSQDATLSQVSLLTAQTSTITDNSSNAFTITNNGTVGASTTNPFGPYYSASFNGTSSYLTISSPGTNFSFGSGNFTVEAWIYNSAPINANSKSIFDLWALGTSDSYKLFLNGNNRLQWAIYADGTADVSALTIPNTTWTHIAWTRSGSNVYLFINGVLKDTTGTTYTANGTANPFIGKAADGSGAFFNGYISNLRVVKGTAVYTGNFTPPTNILRTTQSAMTNIVALTGTETSFLTLQNATIVDNSTNVIAITNVSVTVITAYAPFTASSALGASLIWDSIQAGVTSTSGTSNNTLFTWGAGTTGQLGNNSTGNTSAPSAAGTASIWSVAEKLFSSPVQIGTAYSWTTVAAGASSSMGITSLSTLWLWGSGAQGDSGDSTSVGKSSPTQILGSFVAISAGTSTAFATKTTSALLFAWGYNSVGQLGLADLTSRSSPVQVFAGTTTSPLIPIKLSTVSGSSYTQVTAGSAATVLSSNGLLYTWGNNTTGQVGDNTTIARSSPIQVGGVLGSAISNNSPTQLGTGSWSQVAAGNSHTLAIDSNSSLWAWGKTPANGATANRSNPVQIGSSSWVFVSAGNDVSQAIGINRTLYVWGLNTNYQLGSASFSLNQSVTSPVAIGTLAIVNTSHTIGSAGGLGVGAFIKNI
jgi:alpha-tubulin suppressor-like RCC1 family protein